MFEKRAAPDIILLKNGGVAASYVQAGVTCQTGVIVLVILWGVYYKTFDVKI